MRLSKHSWLHEKKNVTLLYVLLFYIQFSMEKIIVEKILITNLDFIIN
jgi:hypothetical protein